MARADVAGMFWDDTPPPKPPKKEKVKRTPPKRFWEAPDYLPFLDEALAFKPDLYSDMELIAAQNKGERLVFDIEVYPNYVCFGFKGLDTGKCLMFEWHDGRTPDLAKLAWVMRSFLLITFNGIKYDVPISALALAGKGPEDMWEATCMLIQRNEYASRVFKQFKVKKVEVNQIDLIELTALAPGLKKCAGRLHAPRLQDLPFKPGSILSEAQIAIVRWYNINDLDNTIILHNSLLPQIEIRENQSSKYGVDLRSLSDAQMAEAIIGSEVRRLTRVKHIQKTVLPPNTAYRFQPAPFLRYHTPLLNWVFKTICDATFHVDNENGSIVLPEEIKEMPVTIGSNSYQFGVGGMHSKEKSVAHLSDDEYVVIDRDVTSYYPRLILNAGLVPENLGRIFLDIYNRIVTERVSAKAAGEMFIAECLKIVANGTFGKLGSKYSIMYAPQFLLQVTLTGQLSIIMLAERFELAGIQVTSCNTDGITVRCPRKIEHVFLDIVNQWEQETGFSTEETRYKATYSKDINNYIAVYETPQKGELFKTKGLYAKTSSKKNAVNEICVTAIKELIGKGIPVEQTINECQQISMFTTMREVRGGAVKIIEQREVDDWITMGDQFTWVRQEWLNEGLPVERLKIKSGVKPDPIQEIVKADYLGKVIRWYYSTEAQGAIIAAGTGNQVPRSEGAKPCMQLPSEMPSDLDRQWYIDETYSTLTKIGYLKGEGDEDQEDDDEDGEE